MIAKYYVIQLIVTLYSRKYWRELNLVVESNIAIARTLADLNLAVLYRIAIVRNFGGF